MARFHRRRRAHGYSSHYSGWVGRDKSGKKRKPSPYNRFFKKNFHKVAHLPFKQRAKAMAKLWKAHKGGGTHKSKTGRENFKSRLHGLRNLIGSIAGRRKSSGKKFRAHKRRNMSDSAKLKAISVELKRLGAAYEKAVSRAKTKAEKTALRKEAHRKKMAAKKAAKAAHSSNSAAAQKKAVAAAYAEHARRGQHEHPLSGLSGLSFMGGQAHEDELRNKYGGDPRRRRRKKGKKKTASKKRRSAPKRRRHHTKKRAASKKRRHHPKRRSAKKRSAKGRKGLAKARAGLRRYHSFINKWVKKGYTRKQAAKKWKASKR